MPKSAHSLAHAEHANDTRDLDGPHSVGAKHAKDSKRTKSEKGKRSDDTTSEVQSTSAAAATLAQVKKDARPLLIGAGVGAAVALTVVALRGKQRTPTLALFASPNSTFLSAVVKVAAFAIGRTVAEGTLTSVLARAVGRAVA